MKRLICLYLDIISIPGILLNNKANAIYHLKFVCPKCPRFRRKMRDVNTKRECWWNQQWKNRKYEIPRNFGIKNWVTQYFFLKTDLRDFNK